MLEASRRTRRHIFVDPALIERVEHSALSEHRSLSGQLEHIITQHYAMIDGHDAPEKSLKEAKA